MIKVRSSAVLAEALVRIKDGRQRYACAAIQDVETDLRYEHKEDVKSNATKTWMRFKPDHVSESLKSLQEWWPVGSQIRIETLEKAIAAALKAND